MKGFIIAGLLAATGLAHATPATMPQAITHEAVEVLQGQLDGVDHVATAKQLLTTIGDECRSLGGTVTGHFTTAEPSSLGFKVSATVYCSGIQ